MQQAAEAHLLFKKSFEILANSVLNRVVLRIKCLDEDFAGQIATARASGNLREQLECALCGAEIGHAEAKIGAYNSDERDALEIVSLGDHLSSHKDIDLVCVDSIKERLRAAFQARGVGIDARNACLREKFGEVLLDALGATPHRLQILVTAIRASRRHAALVAAMVTMQLMTAELSAVQNGVRSAAGALTHPAAGRTMQRRSIATAVQVHQHLFAIAEPSSHCLQQLGGHAVFHWQAAGVNQPDGRHLHITSSFSQVQAPVMPALGVNPALKRRSR